MLFGIISETELSESREECINFEWNILHPAKRSVAVSVRALAETLLLFPRML